MSSAARFSGEDRAERVAAKVAAAQEVLAEQVAALRSGEDWKQFLDFQARLHQYSPNNVLLIGAQHADAHAHGLVDTPAPTYVAKFNTWKALGRSAEKGQHGYVVLAPMTGQRRVAIDGDGHVRPLIADDSPKTGEVEDRRRQLRGFKVEHVFELGQTAGLSVPLPPRPQLLAGEAPSGFGLAVMSLIEDRGFRVDTVPDAGAIQGANGQTNWPSHTVVIRADMDDAAIVKTLVHEAAHVLLHEGAPGQFLPRSVKEVEAESVAYVVASAHGMATDDYRFPYVAGWAGDDPVAKVQAVQGRVGRAAQAILEVSPAEHGSGGRVPGAIEAAERVHARRTELAGRLEEVPDPAPAIQL
jgi:hypothetical protein